MKTLSLISLILLLAQTSFAGDWQGKIEMRDGVTHIISSDTGYEPPQTMVLKELWRVGDDDSNDEEIFGFIVDIAVDNEGNCYLIDSQLSVIKVFSDEGKYLRSIGRWGAGPGEFYNPSSVLILANGSVGTVQAHPAHFVGFTKDGTPTKTISISTEHRDGLIELINAKSLNDQFIVHGVAFSRSDGQAIEEYFFDRYDLSGQVTRPYFTYEQITDMANMIETDRILYPLNRTRWTVDQEGNLYLAGKEYYEITVCGFEKGSRKIVSRNYKRRERTSSEMNTHYQQIEHFIPAKSGVKIDISEHDADIQSLYARDDGTLYVLTSRGLMNRPVGSCGVFDVFDQVGRFLKQVTVMGQPNPRDDGYYFIGDKFYVVTKMTSTFSRMTGLSDPDDFEPMQVVCYELLTR
ncbi:6-bladed beta-propeller [Patescibacteria group bacterium]